MLQEYKTILNSAMAELEEKKSRFIASVKPVSNEADAVEFISSLKTKYWDASHNVYAYSINNETLIQRYSDDGEPSGTAGMPALEVIKRMGIQDAVVVITRYFGGTLLGASGLIRAYSKSAALGLEAGEVVTRKLCFKLNLVVEYTLFGRLQNMLMSNDNIIKDIQYGQDVDLCVLIEAGKEEKLIADIIENTNGRAICDMGEKTFITLGSDGRLII
ncbi:putative YigZ family protein [Ruminiclostridium sufflavum DSM 19573]|uniref:Putative YigZ family protein n=1 Tax=Ruminiclostridium sufflavum DSM 19573 TaxID=1121337 RepID=A0A318XMX1_9FIRM|nr:YigZ family protein [Ruminiclostridium sufflavum]PYG89212.1 putative YigZ family protein [Ruminiclostridium sufflavum DSM 19573]